MGLTPLRLEVRTPGEIPKAFDRLNRDDVLVVFARIFTVTHYSTIIELAATHNVPAMYGTGIFARAGGLMALSANYPDLLRRTAILIDRILKGAKPADLPVEQPTKFEFVINLKTAKALGLTIPPSLLLRAEQVIDP
jgi:putative ABC transport system substrate-binding protein